MIWVSLGISGVRGYSDTRGGGGWTSLECPGWSGYLQCTGILRRRGGHPRIVQDDLGISGVRGYSDTGVGGGWISKDCPG